MGDWLPYQGAIVFIDPSGRGSDETGYAVVKMLNGYLYVTAAGGLRGGYDEETMIALANIAKREAVNVIVIESNFGDGMFNQLLKPYLQRIYPCSIEEVRSNKQKELRIIDTLEPVMNQHRLIVDPKVIEHDMASTRDYPAEKALKMQLFYQMSRITKDRGALAHDDRLDALAGAVAYWVEQMGLDEDQVIQDRQEAILEAELQAFTGSPVLTIDRLALGMTFEQASMVSDGDGGWFEEY
jgi:hypothetical protein